MDIKLRQYQQDTLKQLCESAKSNKSILMCLATGAGKTVMFTDFARRVASRGYKTLIIVDRVELLQQTAKWGDENCPFGWLTPKSFKPQNVTISMLQTLRARLKQEKYQDWLETFDFVFVDEIHQSYNGTTIPLIRDLMNKNAVFIGVTATPWNIHGYLLDGFDHFILGADIKTLIEQGYLVKPEHYTIDLFDFSKVKVTSTGDYDTGAIDDIVVDTDKIDKVLDGWRTYASTLKTIVFCSTVVSAEHYAEFFRQNGISAECVSAQDSSIARQDKLERFKNGKLQVLFNVGLLVAGFDEPSIECVVFLNPTKILRRYIQCAGRGLRLCPEINKTKCIFLDFVGNSFRHLEVDAIRSYIPAPPEKEKEEYDAIECPACGFVFPITEKVCPECGFELDINLDEENGSGRKPKGKKEFERLIKLKSVQKELHDIIYQFVDLPCLVRIEETGEYINNRPIKKWVYGFLDDGTPIFKGSKHYNSNIHKYPLIKNAKKSNCWYVFHTICTNFNPKLGALRYYGLKLHKAKKMIDKIKNPQNQSFVNLYDLLNK